MENKYYELLNLLNNNGYATSLFEEHFDDEIIESAVIGNKNYFIDISPIGNYIKIEVAFGNEVEYSIIETKIYKNVKSAFNFIKKYLED